jgi:hypothetical protein
MRGVPALSLRHLHGFRCTWRDVDGLAVVLAGAAAGYGEDRSGRSPGVPCAAVDAPGGLQPKGRGEAAAPQRRDPRLNPGHLRRVTLAAHSFSTARIRPRNSTAWAVRVWRAGGAPLKTY